MPVHLYCGPLLKITHLVHAQFPTQPWPTACIINGSIGRVEHGTDQGKANPGIEA